MITVWKYNINTYNGITTSKMPKGAHLIHGEFQEGDLFVWVVVDTEAELVWHQVAMMGTNYEIPGIEITKEQYISSGIWANTGEEYHVFDLGEV